VERPVPDSTSNPTSEPVATVDMARVREEVEAEVRARRAAGVYPPGFERDLDALFDRFAPVPVTDNLENALERSEDAASIDPEIPVASNNPAFGAVKRVMAKLLGWYHQFVVQQVMGLGVAINNVLRTLVDKVTRLETLVGDERIRQELDRLEPDADDSLWQAVAVDAVRGVRGRVAFADAGDGELLAEVCAAGVDAYGIEPRAELVDAGRARGLDVRTNDVVTHLQSVASGDLAGLMLRGCVERMTRPALLELLDRAAGALATGGRLVVMSRTPGTWSRVRSVVEADLTPGRPLHAETWAWLLEGHGFAEVEVVTVGTPESLTPVPEDRPDAAILNANLARLSATLFEPEGFVVTATRTA
jgi:hypothetical protein